MRKRIRRSYLALAITSALLPALFNACGGPNGLHALTEVGLSSSASVQQKVCESQLVADYSTSYHPLLKTNCNQCHSNAHGSNDVRLSFNAFQSKGQALIDFQATHPHGNNNINLTTEIANVQPAWTAATNKYVQCLADNPTEDTSAGIPFGVSEKPMTAISSTSKEYSWNLYTDSDDRAGEIKATFRIQVKLYSYQGSVVGFEFTNPSLQLASGQSPVLIEGIRFTVNGKIQDAVSTYARIQQTVSGTTKTMLAPNLGTALVAVDMPSAATTVGFQFINLK